MKSKFALLGLSFAVFSSLLLSVGVANAGMASGSKFLGNVIASSVPSDWSTYWNQVTPENATKWGSVESNRDSMNWSQADTAYNFANANGYDFKFHTLVWGSQEPGWIGGLSAADQKAEVIEWIQAAGTRYGSSELVDVVNEPLHAKPSYRNAIGGDGTTGWDWVIWSFEQARQAFPNAKLLINEYGIISDPNAASQYVTIINLLKARGLIDGIGIQCHLFNMDDVTVSTMNGVLNTLSATGLPIYVSELDMSGDDATQLQRYQTKFPVLWENPNVKGITLWGYIQGQTWRDGTHLVTSSGAERPALQWLKQYLSGGNTQQPPAAPTGLTATAGNAQVSLSWSASSGATSYTVKRATTSGGTYTNVATNVTSTSYANTGLTNGTTYYYVVSASNGAGSSANSAQVSATPTGGSTGTGTLVAQYKLNNSNATDNQIYATFNIKNTGTSAVSLSTVKLRYYFTKDGSASLNFWKDYAQIGASNVSGAFVSASGTNADTYLEISFGSGAGSIAAGGQTGDIQIRVSKSDWSNFNEANDYSFDGTKTAFSDWSKVTLYQNGSLVWGTAP